MAENYWPICYCPIIFFFTFLRKDGIEEEKYPRFNVQQIFLFNWSILSHLLCVLNKHGAFLLLELDIIMIISQTILLI